jgi:DNA-binding NarL/FixJ family response regulator
MSHATVRILMVDDYEPFRDFVLSMLGTRPELRIVGQASDGEEAVRQAQRLKPQLILLDIGLSRLNGIEAARQIRTVSPESQIMFVTQESSDEVMQEAISSGAKGYIFKSKAAIELLAAVEAVLGGRLFLGSF